MKETNENLPVLKEASLNSAALAKHANYDLAEFKDVGLDVAENSALFNNDIIIPKIWLIQALSQLRTDKKAEEGQYFDSQSEEMLADIEETLKIVILKPFKKWHTFKMVVNAQGNMKKEFVSSELMVLGKNENLPYQETVEGIEYVRRQVVSAYVLTERDVQMQLNKPYIIDFAGSSKLAGRKIVSDIKTLSNQGLPSFVGFFNLTSELVKFDEGSAFVKLSKFGGYLPKKAMPFLIDCYKNLESIENQVVIDDSDVIGTTATKKEEVNVADKAIEAGANI